MQKDQKPHQSPNQAVTLTPTCSPAGFMQALWDVYLRGSLWTLPPQLSPAISTDPLS